MELVGKEKRIRALFSELRFADEQATPRFAAVWNRVQGRTVRPARVFNLLFVAVTVLMICALVSLAIWSKYLPRNTQQNVMVARGTSTPTVGPVQVVRSEANSPVSGGKQLRTNSRPRTMRFTAQRRALVLAVNLKAAREAEAITTWQSPTSALLKSQNDELLKSLPQLNESAEQLKSFLPNTPK